MRRFIYFLGCIALIVIIAAGAGLGVVVYKGNALDAESKGFVNEAVPAIAANWSREQLLDRATPELRESANPEQMRALFNAVSQLGPLVEYQGATGDVSMAFVAGSGSAVTASYVAKAKFMNGAATIRVALLKRDGRWKINGFHVDTSLSGSPGIGI